MLDTPHHDGSAAYVLDRPEELGGSATVRLRVPHGTGVEHVVLRAVRDGEPRAVRAELDEETQTDSWYRATFTVDNPTTRYRWLLAGGAVCYAWVNGLGVIPHDALARGGLRYVSVGDDAIVYLRGHGEERLLCLAARSEHEPVRVPLAGLACRALETVVGADASSTDGIAILPGRGPAFHVWRLNR